MRTRIKKIINEKGLNYSSFADKIQVSRGTISHILNGRIVNGVREFNNPSKETIDKIKENFPDISDSWLLRGEGPMYNREKNFMSQVSSSHPKQPDLFDMNNITEQASEKTQTFNHSQKNETKKPENKVTAAIIPNTNQSSYYVKKIDKIIIFFNDNTFMTFVSEK